jgi:hypothetical protein
MNTTIPDLAVYQTWYDFKKELQRRSGIVLLNERWRQVRPEAPLPWNEIQMRQSSARLLDIIKSKVVYYR